MNKWIILKALSLVLSFLVVLYTISYFRGENFLADIKNPNNPAAILLNQSQSIPKQIPVSLQKPSNEDSARCNIESGSTDQNKANLTKPCEKK